MAGMRPKRRQRRQQEQREKALAERACWRCGRTVGTTAGEALLVVAWADDSYSGVFHVPLCDDCLTHPHTSEMHYVMGGTVGEPAKWVYERLEEDELERGVFFPKKGNDLMANDGVWVSPRRIVDAIVNDLSDRAGLDNQWQAISKDVQDEIRGEWSVIVARELFGLRKVVNDAHSVIDTILTWAQSQTVHRAFTMAAIHGDQVSQEESEAADRMWKSAADVNQALKGVL